VRIVHLFVICALVFAAAYVYRIKMESTVRTESVLRLRADIREQRDAIAALHAEWAKLQTPLRLQGLAQRHLALRSIETTQYDQLKNLPERPPSFARSTTPDPIGAMLNTIDKDVVTGSVPPTSPEDER
jgi:cell division protein FtsL